MTAQERIEYYRNPAVRERMREFLGGDTTHPPTCRYIVAGDEAGSHIDQPIPVTEFDLLLDRGSEVARSLWDGESLLADFDVEYVNFDYPAEAFESPARVFELLEPVAVQVRQTLQKYGVPALHLISGRGHHFIWRIRRESDEFKRLAGLGCGPESLWQVGNQSHLPEGRRVPEDLSRAFAGLGLLMEFLGQEIKQRAVGRSAIPVELTAVEVGPSRHGREMISIDLSEYGDPLHIRMLRSAFSTYLKPWQQRWAIEQSILDKLPTLFVVPQTQSWREIMPAMRDANLAIERAESSSAKIPDGTTAVTRILGDYESSKIAKFHRWFYSEEPHGPELWEATYDRTPLAILPACARMILENPNDLLLRPGCIRQIVRVMLALGWHPRHIAGLIYSKYARPFGWTQFEGYDRLTRADFYTRLFAGGFVAGYDDLVDFNCVSAQEQKVCSLTNCGFNLLDFRESALNRRRHDQLARRPFNRLLLQSEHF